MAALVAGLLVAPGVVPQAETAQAAETQQECSRAGVLAARDAGGPQVRAAAEAALLGGEAEVCAFVRDQWSVRELADRDILATQMFARGGPTMKATLTPLLDAEDPEALRGFLTDGWNDPWLADQEIRINQLADLGGPQVKSAARVALDAGTPEALEQFLAEGWLTAQQVDLELRVNQAFSAGGPIVKDTAAAALDDGRPEAIARFLEVDWGVAAARDHEHETVAGLLQAAEAAGSEAQAATQAATDDADRAVAAAASAKAAAAEARDEARAAGNDRRKAETAAANAARAAQQAASAAGAAVGAANDAAAAARTAANAAVRVAMAAALAERKAAEASRAAAAARTDRGAADTARQKAAEARAAADDVGNAADALDEAERAAEQVAAASDAAISAIGNANDAARAAQEAAEAAAAAGADASAVYAAAERARAAAQRAQRAAQEAVAFARYARDQAIIARDAARSAAAHARAAADAAEDAAEHAGEAVDAARLAREHAEAASQAAQAARLCAQQAQEVYEEARRQDRLRLAREREQMIESARDAARVVEEARQVDAPTVNTPRSQWRPPAVEAALVVANDQGSTREAAVAGAREAALGLVDSGGTWTREAARTALVGDEEQVLALARGGLRSAEGMDDRTTLVGLSTVGTAAMRDAVENVLEGSDAEVAAFLAHPDYPERRGEDELEATRILAAAREVGDAHTVDAATAALDDGSAAALRAFVETGQFVAREADAEIKVTQIFENASEGSERRINAEVALEGPPAFRERFLAVARHEAAVRDHRTTAHVETMSSLVLQVVEVAARATENEKRAWEEAERAAGAAQEAASYADEAADAADEAGAHAVAATDAALRASRSATDAKRSADTAVDAAARAGRSADAAAQSATWATISLARAVKYANEATDSANQAWHDAKAAGQSAIDAAAEFEAAYQRAYDLMLGDLVVEAMDLVTAKAPVGCLMPGDDYWDVSDDYYDQDCLNRVAETIIALDEQGLDPTSLAYINGMTCEAMFGNGGKLFDECIANVLNLDFVGSLQWDLAWAVYWPILHTLEPIMSLQLALLTRGATSQYCKGTPGEVCEDILGEIFGELTADLPDLTSLEYWHGWFEAWREYAQVPSLQGAALDNFTMVSGYFANTCLVTGAGGAASLCVEERVRDALDDLSWTPPSFTVGGHKVRMTTDQMVRVVSRQTWDYFGVLPTNVQAYFAPTDTVADLDRYLAAVVQRNEPQIRDYLDGRRASSQFSLEIDGHVYVVGLQRDGTIVQFYRQ